MPDGQCAVFARSASGSFTFGQRAGACSQHLRSTLKAAARFAMPGKRRPLLPTMNSVWAFLGFKVSNLSAALVGCIKAPIWNELKAQWVCPCELIYLYRLARLAPFCCPALPSSRGDVGGIQCQIARLQKRISVATVFNRSLLALSPPASTYRHSSETSCRVQSLKTCRLELSLSDLCIGTVLKYATPTGVSLEPGTICWLWRCTWIAAVVLTHVEGSQGHMQISGGHWGIALEGCSWVCYPTVQRQRPAAAFCHRAIALAETP